MNKTVIIALVYFVIFIVGGYFFYTKYFYKFFRSEGSVEVSGAKQKGIYYSIGNNLFILDPNVSTRGLEDTPTAKIQTTNNVNDVSVANDDSYFFYNTVSPEKISEIWKAYIGQDSPEKTISNKTPGLENFSNFRHPRISPDNQKMAFMATHNNIDYIFIMNLKDQGLINLTNSVYSGTISSFDWAKDSLGIAFSGVTNNINSIKIIDLNKKISNRYVGDSKITEISYLNDKIIFLDLVTYTNNINTNINYLKEKDIKKTPITDTAYPKQVLNYDISPDNQFISYETMDLITKKTDLYEIKTDGTNLLQLTTDGKSEMPVFSPESNLVAYWLKGAGIYMINLDKTKNEKILNTSETINKILIWR